MNTITTNSLKCPVFFQFWSQTTLCQLRPLYFAIAIDSVKYNSPVVHAGSSPQMLSTACFISQHPSQKTYMWCSRLVPPSAAAGSDFDVMPDVEGSGSAMATCSYLYARRFCCPLVGIIVSACTRCLVGAQLSVRRRRRTPSLGPEQQQ